MKIVFAAGFLVVFASYSVSCSSLSRPLSGARFIKGAGVIGESVHFGFDRWELRPEYRDCLIRKVAVMKRFPKVGLTVEGHTDKIGSTGYNLWLGDRRARTVQVELVRLGVDPRRLIVVSHGETRPRMQGNRPSDLAANRRVDFVVR